MSDPTLTSAGRPSPLLELIKARLREFYREPGIVFWVFGFPLLMAVGLGVAFRSRPAEVPRVAVVTREPSAPLARALLSSERVRAELLAEPAARRALARAKVDVVVSLDGPAPTFLFDPGQEKSPLARLYVDDVLQAAAGRVDPLRPEEQIVSEPGARYVDYLIPGLIGMNLMGSSMWGIGYNLVVARKRRLLRRYAVTPMRRAHFLLSYFFSRLVFLTLEVSLLVAFGAALFGTRVQGSALSLAVVAVFGAASFAGISLIIGARLENTETANGWMNLVQLPMWVLSGIFFSYERFPEPLHRFIELLPLTALINALRGVYNDGSGVLDLGAPLLVLGAWGVAGFLVALRSFRWQ
jgi:ABC-type multidrug transport system permease subunit